MLLYEAEKARYRLHSLGDGKATFVGILRLRSRLGRRVFGWGWVERDVLADSVGEPREWDVDAPSGFHDILRLDRDLVNVGLSDEA